MAPVWCFFDDDGATGLARLSSSKSIELESRIHCAILVPTAPIPDCAAWCASERWSGATWITA